MTEDRYVGLEVLSSGLDAVADPSAPDEDRARASRCRRFGRHALDITGKAGRYMVNAFALTMGATAGCYLAWMMMSKVEPLSVTIFIRAVLPDPG